MLTTKGLSKRYGDFTALNDVSLTLRWGDIYGLIGRNGAGKTTFFKCVLGLAMPSDGEITINGSKTDLGAARRQIGFLINPAFFPYLGARQNLEYLCRIKGVSSTDEVPQLLKLVGLDGVKKPFKAFSTGMKQRLGLAGALLGHPPIVILDEPVNGLDPQGIADMREIIKRENQHNGTTFIISSHILGELDLVATQFGFIEQGRLLKEISHDDLHRQTKYTLEEYFIKLIGGENV
jgi:ABC-2 type transport system ATP-binding protein